MFTIRISFPELAAYTRPDTPLAGRYLIEREIGVGGMAYVFAARDLKHDRVVAVKVLRAEFGASLSADRFTREILIAAGMTHPNILPVHDSGSADGLLFYVMPFVDGETLVDRMSREGRLPVADVSRIAREVATALQFAHNHGIVHRDVKPGNVLLPGGVAVVTDFGLARAIQREDGQTRLTQVGVGLGTPTYMSPEQGAGDHDVDARSDQYSLACMVFEMLTGRPPFMGQSYQKLLSQHVTETAPRVRSIRSDVPMEMDIAIARALRKEPAERFASVEEFARALGGGVSTLQLLATPKRMLGAAAMAVVLVATVFTTGRWTRRDGARTLDPNLVAIAPFRVIGNSLSVWREGLVDVLARDFDGAGPLRTVSPSMVLRNFQGSADRATAVALGKSVGAGIVVYGQLLETGSARDSVRARVTVQEVANDSVVADFEVANASTQMDAVADSIAISSLRQLGKSRSIAAVPRAYFGARSLPALKYFLQGEQKYRNNEFLAARADYEQAIALDSTFALAYRRMRGVLRGINGESDSLSLSFAARAGAANRGTSPRDSLLILADSLAAVHRRIPAYADGRWIASVRRRIAALEQAAQQYKDDPEVWTELGEARVHYGDRIGIDARQSLDAFEHALRIDSTYGPAFHHSVDLTMQLRGAAAAIPLVERYIRVNPSDHAFGLVPGVLRGQPLRQLTSQVDSQRADVLSDLQMLARYPDEADVLSNLYEHYLTLEHVAREAPLRRLQTRRFAFRGRAKAAVATTDTTAYYGTTEGTGIALAFAQTGSISKAEASAIFAHVARDQNLEALPLAFPWWLRERDTTSLKGGASLAQQGLRAGSPVVRGLAQYADLSANAYLSLAHGDTSGALKAFMQLPDSAMPRSLMPLRIDVARLLLGRNQAREACVYLDARPPFPGAATIWDVEWHLERARAARRVGDISRARTSYSVVATAWNHADAEFQPSVAEARSALREMKAPTT